jgi:two-component system LytT family response regulator
VVLSKPLKEYAEILPDTVFLRTHKSYLVNLNSIKSFKYKSLILTLYSGDDVLVSRRNKTSVLNKVVQNNSIELLKNT